MQCTSLKGTSLTQLPRLNFGLSKNSTNEEDLFADAFIRAYDTKYSWIHNKSLKQNRAMVREVAVNGFGIADLVTVSWAQMNSDCSSDGFAESFQTRVRAFEFKIKDWRKGLMQAHRYRFYADVAILVIPAQKLHKALAYIESFQAINVGLWGFNRSTGRIVMHFTPRPRFPATADYRKKAINTVLHAANQDQPIP